MKIKKFNEITVDDLYHYKDIREEDPIGDGPILLSTEEEEEFMSTLDKEIISEEDFGFIGGVKAEHQDYLFKKFVDYVNMKNTTLKYGFDWEFE